MDAIIELVAKQAGIDEAAARKAVELVVGQLKERLPEPIAGQIESLLEGGEGADLGDLSGGLGGLLGRD